MKSSSLLDIRGQTFSRLTVLSRATDYKNGSARWLCRCECGTEIIVLGQRLRNKHTKSCGCLSAETARVRRLIHGDSGTRLFNIWGGMLNRCSNPNNENWHNYGGRGIAVCSEWKAEFLAFKAWALSAGYSDTLSIDRKDNNGNYTPDNCRWVDAKAQARNTRNNVRLEDGRLAYEVAEANGLSTQQCRQRVRNGMSLEEAALTPNKLVRPLLPDGRLAVEVAALNGVPASTFYARIRKYGWELERAASTPVRGS